MKKSIYIPVIIISLCTMMMSVSDTSSAQTIPMITRTVITPLQAGTVTLHGSATVDLTKDVTDVLAKKYASPSYYVVLTPIGIGDSKLALSDINDGSFKIISDSKGKSEIQVQFVVFVKETITMPDPGAAAHAPHSTTAIQLGK